LDVAYEVWDVPPRELEAKVHALRHPSCLGANVTVPHKQAVIPFLDELGGTSARIGAVNTIVNREGRLFGFNTDGPGLVEALRRNSGFEPRGKSILVLGAGGAARGIVFALVEERAGAVAIANRTAARAAELATAAGPVVRVVKEAYLGDYAAVINTTSVGMRGTGTEGESPCEFDSAGPNLLAVDIVYVPERTTFLAQAEARGLPTLGGLPMLIYQGALAFTHWTGMAAPVEVMMEAAEAELARRHAHA
jgi:shikimate dehydrogenase